MLARRYLNLGGRILAFNVDKDFNNAVDALIMVDLDRTQKVVLGRYMGKDGAAGFLAHQPSVTMEQE